MLLATWILLIAGILNVPLGVTATLVCCPKGWSLVKIDLGLFRPYKYDCLNITANNKAYNKFDVFKGTAPVFGYGIQRYRSGNHDNNVPGCEQQIFTVSAGGRTLEVTPQSCLASIDGTIIAISCPLRTDEYMKPVTIVHKCCPPGHAYDSTKRKCVQRDSSFKEYGIFSHNNVLAFINGPVDCPKDKVLVEYHLAADQFGFGDGELVILDTGQAFAIDDYCVEAVIGESGPTAIASETDTFTNSQMFLVRTCENSAVCSHLPCVRRCCADGEMFTKGNATSYCKKDETDIYFHSFESLAFSGNFSKPAVFGILRGLDCLKFRLDPDSYSDEMHTIDERNGYLHVLTTKKRYSHNQYCMEKTRNSSRGDQRLFELTGYDLRCILLAY